METQTPIDIDFEDGDVTFASENQTFNSDDREFDLIIEKLQETVLCKKFENLQQKFIQQNSNAFDSAQENKLEYLQMFKKYQTLVQNHLIKQLQELPNFTMQRFQHLLKSRKQQVDEQIMDILLSLTNFQQFKAMMIDAKQEHKKEDKLENLLTIRTNKTSMKSDKKTNNIFSKPQFELQKPFSIQGLKKGNVPKK